MQVTATMICHFMYTRMAIIKKKNKKQIIVSVDTNVENLGGSPFAIWIENGAAT